MAPETVPRRQSRAAMAARTRPSPSPRRWPLTSADRGIGAVRLRMCGLRYGHITGCVTDPGQRPDAAAGARRFARLQRTGLLPRGLGLWRLRRRTTGLLRQLSQRPPQGQEIHHAQGDDRAHLRAAGPAILEARIHGRRMIIATRAGKARLARFAWFASHRCCPLWRSRVEVTTLDAELDRRFPG